MRFTLTLRLVTISTLLYMGHEEIAIGAKYTGPLCNKHNRTHQSIWKEILQLWKNLGKLKFKKMEALMRYRSHVLNDVHVDYLI